ncbi:unnamed protein product [Closterium sp. Yama58-4]|nr:unnamed protein product [Closterium sp. Yama58-4]
MHDAAPKSRAFPVPENLTFDLIGQPFVQSLLSPTSHAQRPPFSEPPPSVLVPFSHEPLMSAPSVGRFSVRGSGSQLERRLDAQSLLPAENNGLESRPFSQGPLFAPSPTGPSLGRSVGTHGFPPRYRLGSSEAVGSVTAITISTAAADVASSDVVAPSWPMGVPRTMLWSNPSQLGPITGIEPQPLQQTATDARAEASRDAAFPTGERGQEPAHPYLSAWAPLVERSGSHGREGSGSRGRDSGGSRGSPATSRLLPLFPLSSPATGSTPPLPAFPAAPAGAASAAAPDALKAPMALGGIPPGWEDWAAIALMAEMAGGIGSAPVTPAFPAQPHLVSGSSARKSGAAADESARNAQRRRGGRAGGGEPYDLWQGPAVLTGGGGGMGGRALMDGDGHGRAGVWGSAWGGEGGGAPAGERVAGRIAEAGGRREASRDPSTGKIPTHPSRTSDHVLGSKKQSSSSAFSQSSRKRQLEEQGEQGAELQGQKSPESRVEHSKRPAGTPPGVTLSAGTPPAGTPLPRTPPGGLAWRLEVPVLCGWQAFGEDAEGEGEERGCTGGAGDVGGACGGAEAGAGAGTGAGTGAGAGAGMGPGTGRGMIGRDTESGSGGQAGGYREKFCVVEMEGGLSGEKKSSGCANVGEGEKGESAKGESVKREAGGEWDAFVLEMTRDASLPRFVASGQILSSHGPDLRTTVALATPPTPSSPAPALPTTTTTTKPDLPRPTDPTPAIQPAHSTHLNRSVSRPGGSQAGLARQQRKAVGGSFGGWVRAVSQARSVGQQQRVGQAREGDQPRVVKQQKTMVFEAPMRDAAGTGAGLVAEGNTKRLKLAVAEAEEVRRRARDGDGSGASGARLGFAASPVGCDGSGATAGNAGCGGSAAAACHMTAASAAAASAAAGSAASAAAAVAPSECLAIAHSAALPAFLPCLVEPSNHIDTRGSSQPNDEPMEPVAPVSPLFPVPPAPPVSPVPPASPVSPVPPAPPVSPIPPIPSVSPVPPVPPFSPVAPAAPYAAPSPAARVVSADQPGGASGGIAGGASGGITGGVAAGSSGGIRGGVSGVLGGGSGLGGSGLGGSGLGGSGLGGSGLGVVTEQGTDDQQIEPPPAVAAAAAAAVEGAGNGDAEEGMGVRSGGGGGRETAAATLQPEQGFHPCGPLAWPSGSAPASVHDWAWLLAARQPARTPEARQQARQQRVQGGEIREWEVRDGEEVGKEGGAGVGDGGGEAKEQGGEGVGERGDGVGERGGEAGLPGVILEAVEGARLSRRDFQRWQAQGELSAQATGCFLRLRLGRKGEHMGGTGYCMGRITAIASMSKKPPTGGTGAGEGDGAGAAKGGPAGPAALDVELSSCVDSSPLALVVDLGDREYTVDGQFLSNKPFLEVEVSDWCEKMWRRGGSALLASVLSHELLQSKLNERRSWK